MKLLTAILCLSIVTGKPYIPNAVEFDSAYIAMDIKKKKKKKKKADKKGKKKKKKGFFKKFKGAK